MSLLQLFKNYNAQIERYKSAIQFFESNPDKIDSHLNRFRDVMNEMDNIHKSINNCGYILSDDEILNGFRQIKVLEDGK